MSSIPLRTVRPFIVDDVSIEEAADEEGFELSDKMAITKFLKRKVWFPITSFVSCTTPKR